MMTSRSAATIEMATASDLPSIRAVDAAAGPLAWAVPDIEMAIAEGRCLVARVAGEIVGITFEQVVLGCPVVTKLRVVESHRRRGIGTDLLRGVVGRTAGDRLFVTMTTDNVPMRSLCGRLGFVSSGYIEGMGDAPVLVYAKWMDDGMNAPGAASRDDIG